jgi:hypothetical protein
MQKCLLQKSPPPSIYLFLPLCPSFSISILYVAISERLPLLLLMGDVNHRCANNMKKHVHSTTREREREKTSRKKEGCCCCCLFEYIDSATHTHTDIRTSRAVHVHLTLFVFFSLSRSLSFLCCYICVIFTSWYPSSMDDDEKRARRRCLWMHARSNLE